LGLAGRLVRPGLSDPEQLFPILAKESLHPLLAGVMLAAILSAIMSTVSSQLLVAASAVSRDLLERGFGVARSGRASLLAGRAAVVVLGLLAMAVAVGQVRVVFWFVLFAWSGLGAAFGPVLLLSLWTRRVTPWGASAGIATGFLVTVLWKVSGLSDRYIYELVPAFFLAGAAVLLAGAVERRLRKTLPRPVVP
jgi:Na+/proline symporter